MKIENMLSDFEECLKNYIADWKNNILGYGIDILNDGTNKYKYHFKMFNGAFKNESAEYEFSYFRALDCGEIVKFIFRSLSAHSSNYKFNPKTKKFDKSFICY